MPILAPSPHTTHVQAVLQARYRTARGEVSLGTRALKRHTARTPPRVHARARLLCSAWPPGAEANTLGRMRHVPYPAARPVEQQSAPCTGCKWHTRTPLVPSVIILLCRFSMKEPEARCLIVTARAVTNHIFQSRIRSQIQQSGSVTEICDRIGICDRIRDRIPICD